MAKPFLLVNPRAANGATGRHFDEITGVVREVIGDHDHAFTQRPMHAKELCRAALLGGAELIIATGGDGTINEVVNGFFHDPVPGEAPRPINPAAALAVLPRGTGGDLRRTIGLDGDLKKSAARLRGEKRAIDVGRADFIDPQGKPAARYFINVAGVGVGAEIVSIVNQSSKRLGGKLTFMIGSLRGLAGWQDVSVRASFDGGEPEELMVTSFSVANGRYFGGGMIVAPEAKLDDGLFHVTIWRGLTFTDFVFKSSTMYDGSHLKLEGSRSVSAKTVRLEPGAKAGGRMARLELDGELVGQVPVTYTLLAGALQLVS